MKLIDLGKKVDMESDAIPVEVWVGDSLVRTAKSLYYLTAHGGLELDRKIRRIKLGREKIIVHIN